MSSNGDHNENANEDRWQVRFDSGQIRLLTLEELDAAFEAGSIHENTLLCRLDEDEWETLAVVAGLTDDSPTPVHAVDPGVPTPRATPVLAQPTPTGPPVMATFVPPNTAHAAYVPAAPAYIPSAAPASYVPTAAPAAFRPSGMPGSPNSTVPVVRELSDFDLDAPNFKPKRRVGLYVAGAAAVAAIGAFAAFSSESPAASTPASAAALLAPAQPPATRTVATTTPIPTPAPETTTDKAPTSNSDSARFSEDMKRALMDKDVKLGQKIQKLKRTRATAPAPRRSAPNTGGVFRKGGSASDPLNSSL